MQTAFVESRGTTRSTPEAKGDARPATTSMFNGQLAIHGSALFFDIRRAGGPNVVKDMDV
jgi:hypothetical protein